MEDNLLKWYFPKAPNISGRGENDPQKELFMGDVFQMLVRESIQNSLDHPSPNNKANKVPVRVEYKLRKYSTTCYPYFQKELLDHINSCYSIFKADRFKRMLEVLNSNSFYMLELADYNTLGMDYKYDYENNTGSGRFYKFVRISGSPNDNVGAGGSHGYGKITYFSASEINTIIVSSMTEDGMCTFEGTSKLATHPTKEPFWAYLDSGFLDRGDGTPVQNKIGDSNTIIPEVFRRQEPGTTVFIPFVEIDDRKNDKSVIFKKCCEAVLRNFFAAINDGMLEVTIDFCEYGENYLFNCNHSNIEEIFKKRFFYDPPYDKARRNIFENFNPYPYWLAYINRETVINDDISFDEAVEKCAGKKYIWFRKTLPILGKTSLFVNVDLQRGNDVVLFMRCPRMVVKVQRSSNSGRGFSAVFLCDDDRDGKGNQLLRYMEDAAHKTWSKAQLKIDKRPQEMIDKADQIEEEIASFLNDCLNTVFPSNQSDSDEVELEDFSMPIMSDNDSTNPLIGSLVNTQGNDDDIKGAPVDIHQGDMPKRQKPLFISTAQVAVPKKVKESEVETDIKGGGNKKKSKNKGGETNYDEDPYAEEKIVRVKISVRYRVFADDNNGQTVYTLIVHSPQRHERVILSLSPVGETEDSNSSVHLQKTSSGIIKGNVITGVSLNNGKNIITFTVDNQGEYAFSLLAEKELTIEE